MRRPGKREYDQYQTLILIMNQVKTEDAPARELAISLQPSPFVTDHFVSDRRPDQLDVGTKVRVTSEALSEVRPAASGTFCVLFDQLSLIIIIMRGNERRR